MFFNSYLYLSQELLKRFFKYTKKIIFHFVANSYMFAHDL